MKKKYLNAVYTRLILDRDYEPLRTGDGAILLNTEIRVLQKYKNQVHILVELLDGDGFNPESIAAKLASARQMVMEANPSQIIHLMMVFIFDDAPDKEILHAINGMEESSNPGKKYLSCFTIILKEKTVSYNQWVALPTDGIDRILKQSLLSSNDEYESLPDLSRIFAQKARDYTIQLKAEKPKVTYTLIGINAIVWLLSGLGIYIMGYQNLLEFGAKSNELIIKYGELWRLFTPVFLHANLIHLLVNSYSLYILGQDVERIFGHFKFLIVYLAAGIIGNIASLIFSPHPAVGASGSIFGLLGAILYYGLENPKVFKKYFGSNVIMTIILNVAIGFSLSGIVDNFAHLGGLTGGFLTAGAVRVNASPSKFPSRYLFLAVTILLTVAGLYYGFHR